MKELPLPQRIAERQADQAFSELRWAVSELTERRQAAVQSAQKLRPLLLISVAVLGVLAVRRWQANRALRAMAIERRGTSPGLGRALVSLAGLAMLRFWQPRIPPVWSLRVLGLAPDPVLRRLR